MSKIRLTKQSEPTTLPGAGKTALYVDSTTNELYMQDNSDVFTCLSNLGLYTHVATAKTSPAVTDSFIVLDSSNSYAPKELGISDWRYLFSKEILLLPQMGVPTTTAGCSAATNVEMGTNKQNIKVFDFDAVSVESACWTISVPLDFNVTSNTLVARYHWFHGAGASAYGVAWGMKAYGYADGTDIDSAYGTQVITTDTGGTANTMYMSALSSSITIGGGGAASRPLIICVSRETGDGGDTLDVDARLAFVVVTYTRGT